MKILNKIITFVIVAVLCGGNISYVSAVSDDDNNAGAYYLVDEDFLFMSINSSKPLPSGWDVQDAGGRLVYDYHKFFKIVDESEKLPVILDRKIHEQTGTVTFETKFSVAENMDGSCFKIRNKQNPVVSIELQNNEICLKTPDGYISMGQYLYGKEYGIKAILDIPENKVSIYINGQLKVDNASFLNKTDGIDNIQIMTGNEATGSMNVGTVKLYKGFEVNEKFITSLDNFPSDWERRIEGGSVNAVLNRGSTNPDIYSLKMEDASVTDQVSASKTFESIKGDATVEYKFNMLESFNGFSAEITSGNTSFIKVPIANQNLCYIDKKGEKVPVYKLTDNVWYVVKLVIHQEKNTYDIYLNGKKKCGGLPLLNSAENINKVIFATTNAAMGTVWIDDIVVKQNPPEPDDYVPAPVIPKDNGYNIGVQSCNLWRDGKHLGWDRINGFSERTPYLGFYDDGNPEVKDWEIKWMLEYGIDFEFYCWFRARGNEGLPIKDPYCAESLHEGFFNAKYSDLTKFSFTWENSSSFAKDLADFKENIVPYWIEYYFKDPRFEVIDNKPLVGIYSATSLVKNLGSKEAVKEALGYLKQECKKIGYDGAIIITSTGSADAKQLQEYKDMGFDAIYQYGWERNSHNVESQKAAIAAQGKAGVIDIATSISVGRNDLAWNGPEGKYLTTEQYDEMLSWTKKEFLPSLSKASPLKKTILLDNWNEIGEGHFIIPSNLHGFGYLDAVRKEFTGSEPIQGVVPTARQKERLDRLYIQDRVVGKKIAEKPEMTDKVSFEWNFNDSAQGWGITKDVENLNVVDGKLTGVSVGSDPGVISQPVDIPIDNVSYIKIGLKNTTVDSAMMLYYITDSDTAWAENKSLKGFTTTNAKGYSEVIINTRDSAKWGGRLRQLRLDPFATKGEFGIDYITLLEDNVKDTQVRIDNSLKRFMNKPYTKDDRLMVPAIETFEMMGYKSSMDKLENKITVISNENVVAYTVGSNEVLVNGVKFEIDKAPEITDHVVYIPIRYVVQGVNADLKWDEAQNCVQVTTKKSAVSSENKAPIVPGVWNFNTNNDFENWKGNGDLSKLTVKDGYLTGKVVGNDPMIISADNLGLDANKYKRIKIKLKNSTSDSSGRLYFVTNKSPNWSEEKSISFAINPNSDKYIEYVIDTTTYPLWKDIINKLRLDMTSQQGNMGIDYIIIDDGIDKDTNECKNALVDSTMESKEFKFDTKKLNAEFSRDIAHTGRNSLKISDNAEGEFRIIPTINDSGEYTFSLFAYSKVNGKIELKVKDAVVAKADIPSNKWTEVKGDFTFEKNDGSDLQITVTTDLESLYLDDVQLKFGKK